MIPQLRVRSEFSYRKAYGAPTRIAERLVEIDCPVAGLVDTSGTWGHVRWEKALAKAGVQPAFGAEFTIETDSGKPVAWCLAEDIGQFYRFSSRDQHTPEAFAEAQGIIRFSGAALTDPACFDYVDINPLSIRQAKKNIELAARTCRPLVLTSDNDYPGPNDRDRYLALIDYKKTSPQWILSDEEMRKAFWFLDDRLYHYAKMGTLEVAERLKGIKLPRAPVIEAEGDLPALVAEGLKYRMAAGHIKAWTPDYQARLEREMAMIHEKNYESYFIVVSDLVLWAKQRMLVGPARGSSAGSLVCYLLRITEVDPLVHGLIFERFIDINRNDLPDIDIDFNDQKRELCFDYMVEKYGADHIAHIGNVNTLKPRSVMAQVGKNMGVPANATFAVRNVLLEYSSGDSRYGKGLEDTFTLTRPGQEFLKKYPEAALMGDVEGHASHSGVHAAGILVCHKPIVEYCTVRDGVAQLDKPDTEHLNLLKIDALGLRTLGVIEDTGCMTNEQLYALTLDDPEVFKIFNDRKFSGIFQFEGGAQRRVSIQIPVTSFKQIDHVTALARPGPLGGGATNSYIKRNMGTEPITYRHPSMERYLGDTLGLVLYQESVMNISREIGQFPWEVVSEIRKSMSGRKGKEYFDRRGDEFVQGAMSIGLPETEARTIWEEICSFGAWGMNKCTSLNTKVKLAHPNQFLGPEPTVEELYRYYKEAPSAWIRQQKSMPVLLAVGNDGVARPAMAVDIYKTGPKICWRYEFSDGKFVECTPDHKFVVNGEWRRIGDAELGDLIDSVGRDRSSNNFLKGREKSKHNGRIVAERKFRAAMKGKPCEDCCCASGRLEVHHNDHQHGAIDKDDLAWLCSSCHKLRHKKAGDWAVPYDRGWRRYEPVTLLAATCVGEQETYDIEMPHPHHNYVLANGIVTHNSHTVSYAIISYWCAYMKRYHSTEYAAACLRNAKDEEQTVEILRELSDEGVGFVPFDPELSERNWVAKDGKLIGGFTNLLGIGPAKAEYYVQKRLTQGLDEKDMAKLRKCPVKNEELRPAHALWGDIYADPSLHNIAGRVKEFRELTDWENAVVICKVVRKERRDENETVRLARRGGKRYEGQSLFLDVFVVDDSVSKPVVLRVKTKHWLDWGEKLADRAIDGQEWLLVRGKWLEQFSMLTAEKVKCLSNPDLFL
jgi:hypothetical protein